MQWIAVRNEVLALGDRGFGEPERHLRVANGVGQMRDHAGFGLARQGNAQRIQEWPGVVAAKTRLAGDHDGLDGIEGIEFLDLPGARELRRFDLNSVAARLQLLHGEQAVEGIDVARRLFVVIRGGGLVALGLSDPAQPIGGLGAA